jgi:hypothetical protein
VIYKLYRGAIGDFARLRHIHAYINEEKRLIGLMLSNTRQLTQLFDHPSKDSHCVSHKIFHNPQILSLSAFIAAALIATSPQPSLRAVYSKGTAVFRGHEKSHCFHGLNRLIGLR